MLYIGLKLISLRFLNKDFLWISNLDVVLFLFTLRIFVFNVKNAEKSILTSWEKNLIVKTNSKSLNWKTVSLNFEWFNCLKGVLQDLDRPRLIIFSHSRKESSATMHDHYLWEVDISLIFRVHFHVSIDFFDCLLSTNSENPCFGVRFASNAREIHILEFKFRNWVGYFLSIFTLILIYIEFPHENTAIPATRNKSRVIIQPLDTSDFTYMSFVVELRRTFSSVKLVHTDVVLISASKQMASIWESYFSATFDRDFFKSL